MDSAVQPQATTEEQRTPSFREAVAATQQQSEQRLNDLATSAGAAPAAPSAAEAPPQQAGISAAQQQAIETAVGEMSQEQFEAWYKAQPEGALKRAAKNIADYLGSQMREQFGELLGLGDLAQADPKVRKKLERLVKDPNAREFILNKAFEIFDPAEYAQAPQTQAPGQQYSQPVTPDQVQGIVSDTIAQERQRIAYEADRSRELEALVREVPALNWTAGDDTQKQKAAKKVAHIIDIAEKRSTNGQRVSYRAIADELDMIGSANPPQPVPQTSSTSTPPAQDQQAPRNEVEARSRMSKLLEQHGGLMGLAAALPTRRG